MSHPGYLPDWRVDISTPCFTRVSVGDGGGLETSLQNTCSCIDDLSFT